VLPGGVKERDARWTTALPTAETEGGVATPMSFVQIGPGSKRVKKGLGELKPNHLQHAEGTCRAWRHRWFEQGATEEVDRLLIHEGGGPLLFLALRPGMGRLRTKGHRQL